MVKVNDEGQALLTQTSLKMSEFRGLKARIEQQMREALETETYRYSDELARLVAKMLDQGVPKAQIAKACGYKNYYVSLKQVDEQAQKYRGVGHVEPSVPNDGEAPSLQWEILEASEWTEPNQWGEREISLQMLFGDVRATVWVTEAENKRDITYVDLPENPNVTIADVKALKNEITGALDG